MRRPRAKTILTRWLVPAVLAAAVFACSPDDEAVVAVDLAPGGSVDEGAPDGSAAEAGASQQPADDLTLRTPVDASVPPAPPTLAPGASTQPTTPATPPPTTAPPAPAPQAASTTVSSPAPTTGQPAVAESVAPTETPPPTAAVTADVAQIEAGELHSFTMLNDLRVGLGLPALARDAEMDAFAREWSRQMAESQRFEHSDGPYGENIAFTSNTQLTAAEAAELFHQLWVESPEHYSNMANDRYTLSGIGLYLTANGWYGTHVFKF